MKAAFNEKLLDDYRNKEYEAATVSVDDQLVEYRVSQVNSRVEELNSLAAQLNKPEPLQKI